VATDTARMPILRTWPTVLPLPSLIAITSPGLIERSISRISPAIRLPKVFCKPKPMARPKAPENTVSAVKLIPSRSMPMKNASAQTMSETIFSPSTCCAESRLVARAKK
jgi:hypothetical protein